MNTRNFSTAAFVAVCLLLSGLVLRRQIIAHPVTRERPQNPGNGGQRPFSFLQGEPVDKRTWHVATGPERAAVLDAIQAELAACRAGDARTALFYQSRQRRREFPSPAAFLSAVRKQFPEWASGRSAAQFGPVWADADGQHADVVVTMPGENGRQAQDAFEMVRGRDLYRIADVTRSE